MQEILLKTNFKRGLSRSLKKLTLFFLSYLVPFNRKEHEKQKGVEVVTSCSSGYKASSEKFLY